jgi:hypothetical protein
VVVCAKFALEKTFILKNNFMLHLSRTVLAFALISLLACSETPHNQPVVEQVPPADAPVKTGGDRDTHGCIGSAGYQWSALRGECIRLFEKGIRLNPKAANLAQTTSAFVVFKSDTDDAVAELHLPSGTAPLNLAKDNSNGAGKWTGEHYVLTQWKGMYSLEDDKKVLLYEGPAAQ